MTLQGRPLPTEVGGRVLVGAAAAARLPARVAEAPRERADEHDLFAYVIAEREQSPDDLVDVFARQLARELIAAIARELQPTAVPMDGPVLAHVPTTGHPIADDDRASLHYAVTGDRDGLLIGLRGPVGIESSTEASVRRDNDEPFHAFTAVGIVHRLQARWWFERLDRQRVAAVRR